MACLPSHRIPHYPPFDALVIYESNSGAVLGQGFQPGSSLVRSMQGCQDVYGAQIHT